MSQWTESAPDRTSPLPVLFIWSTANCAASPSTFWGFQLTHIFINYCLKCHIDHFDTSVCHLQCYKADMNNYELTGQNRRCYSFTYWFTVSTQWPGLNLLTWVNDAQRVSFPPYGNIVREEIVCANSLDDSRGLICNMHTPLPMEIDVEIYKNKRENVETCRETLTTVYEHFGDWTKWQHRWWTEATGLISLVWQTFKHYVCPYSVWCDINSLTHHHSPKPSELLRGGRLGLRKIPECDWLMRERQIYEIIS